MKTIHLIHYNKPYWKSIFIEERKYRVLLGNGTKKIFESEKACLKYLADTNRMLTFKLHEYNMIHCDIYRMYRMAWFYFDKVPGSERKILSSFEAADKLFYLLIDRAGFENGNHFVFSHFKAIEENLRNALYELKELYHRLNHHSIVYDLECMLQRIIYVSQSIDNYVLPEKMEVIEKQETILKVVG